MIFDILKNIGNKFSPNTYGRWGKTNRNTGMKNEVPIE